MLNFYRDVAMMLAEHLVVELQGRAWATKTAGERAARLCGAEEGVMSITRSTDITGYTCAVGI
jgi:hypothetical protein